MLPPRRLRLSTQFGIALTSALGALYLLSTVTWIQWEFGPPYTSIVLYRGAVSFEQPNPSWFVQGRGFTIAWTQGHGVDLLPRPSPYRRAGGGVSPFIPDAEFCLPLWIPFLLVALPSWLLERADRRRRARTLANHCPACNYPLRGLAAPPGTGPTCPECGHAP
ncbi:MAG: hypothetical protein WD749_14915 [Phycisphaerales bacterium]